MKKSDWWFLVTAALLALAIWYFFVRPKAKGSPLKPGSSAAEPNQDAVTGSGIVEPDASDFAAGHYNVDYSSLYP